MRRGELKRKSGLKRGGNLKRTPTGMTDAERKSPERQAWLDEGFRQGTCAVTRRGGGQPYHVHHVIYEQEVERCHGAGYTLAHKYDVRNGLRLATHVHELHHNQTDDKVPLRCLRDENIAYAFELLGPGAYDWLKRRYSGPDERVELALAELSVGDDR